MLMQVDVLEYLISRCPGRTEIELARAIYGERAYQQLVNQDCDRLSRTRKVERRGAGGQADPFRYYPK